MATKINIPETALSLTELMNLDDVPATAYRVEWGHMGNEESVVFFTEADEAESFYTSLESNIEDFGKTLALVWVTEYGTEEAEEIAWWNVNAATNHWGQSFDVVELAYLFDQEIAERVQGYTTQEWFDKYCVAHLEKYGEHFVLDTQNPQF